jgi:hypothetical protein
MSIFMVTSWVGMKDWRRRVRWRAVGGRTGLEGIKTERQGTRGKFALPKICY